MVLLNLELLNKGTKTIMRKLEENHFKTTILKHT
jgi:hypothetical protein